MSAKIDFVIEKNMISALKKGTINPADIMITQDILTVMVLDEFFKAYTDPSLVHDGVDPEAERKDILKYLVGVRDAKELEAIEYKRRLIMLNKGVGEDKNTKK